MLVSPIGNVSFNGLFTKPVTIQESGSNVMKNIEESFYYRFSNESKEEAMERVKKATDFVDITIDSESDLSFEQGKRVIMKGKLPFSTGEWLQYASFNKNLPENTKILIEEILKRYNLSHYIRNAKV